MTTFKNTQWQEYLEFHAFLFLKLRTFLTHFPSEYIYMAPEIIFKLLAH